MNLIVKWLNILDVGNGKVIKLPVQKVHRGQRHIISSENDLSKSEKVVYGKGELDSHADNTVTGARCCILQYTG